MEKKEYVKPYIRKHTAGAMNKYGSSYQKAYRDEIAGVKIDDIVAKFGSPVFVYDEKALRNRFREVHREFSNRYPKIQFSWSYKTNYLGAICAIYHQEGSIAEVVSEFEYQKARKLGVPGNKIIFNVNNQQTEYIESTDTGHSDLYADVSVDINAPVLVLPVKTTTGDPAGQEGAMYVNTQDNALRLYADGAWRSVTTW